MDLRLTLIQTSMSKVSYSTLYYMFLLQCFSSVEFIFGLITSFAGLGGLLLGSGSSYLLRSKYGWIDPVICGAGCIASCLFFLLGIYLFKVNVQLSYGMVFVGQLLFSANFAVICDISMVSFAQKNPHQLSKIA